MFQNLMNNRKKSGMILGGLAAFAFYKYSRMSTEDKSKMAQTIKDTARDIFNQIVPGGFKKTAENAADTKMFADAPPSGSF